MKLGQNYSIDCFKTIVIHEMGHHIFPKGKHNIIYAMGFLRSLELGRERSIYNDGVKTYDSDRLARKALALGQQTRNREKGWLFLCLMADGKSEEEAERIVSGS